MSSNTSSEPAPALERIAEIVALGGESGVAVFLDYDGTLTPIVDRPELAVLGERMRSVLRELARVCPVAIVSGRDLSDVRDRVGIDGLHYAGSHGFDIAGPDGLSHAHPDAFGALPALDAAQHDLEQATAGVEGVLIERKRFGIAVHYRLVGEQDAIVLEGIVDRVSRSQRGLRRTTGKKVFELRPDVAWDKGRAVTWLRDLLWPERVPIYVGDDDTDEDAFRAIADCGVGIAVLDAPRRTAAAYSLRDPAEVGRFLRALAGSLAR